MFDLCVLFTFVTFNLLTFAVTRVLYYTVNQPQVPRGLRVLPS